MNLKLTLRWLAVLPSAIGGFIIGSVGINLLGLLQRWLIGISEDSGYAKITYWIFSSLAAGALTVYWGSMVAPNYKEIVGVVLACLIVVIGTLGFVFSPIENGWFWPLACSISLVLGAGAVMYQIFENKAHIDL